MSNLSNADMQVKINAGESVMFQGRVITTIADLPTDDQIQNAAYLPVNKISSGTSVTIAGTVDQTIMGPFINDGDLIIDGQLTVLGTFAL